jgi:hypothetical protein
MLAGDPIALLPIDQHKSVKMLLKGQHFDVSFM